MNKDEIKSLIAAKIAGQGTAVDAGSVLPTILNGIIDLIPTLPEPYVLPTASAENLGGVKVGDGLQISEGVLSATGGGSEPLIVEGTANLAEGGFFIPNEGQASHEDAVEAFCNGTVVLLDIVDEDAATHTLYSVTSFDFNSSKLTADNFTW